MLESCVVASVYYSHQASRHHESCVVVSVTHPDLKPFLTATMPTLPEVKSIPNQIPMICIFESKKTKTFFFKLCILLTTVLKLAVLVGDGNKFLNMYIITCCWTLKNILRINHNNPINCFQLFSEQMYLDTVIFLKLFLQPDHFQAFHNIADGEQF